MTRILGEAYKSVCGNQYLYFRREAFRKIGLHMMLSGTKNHCVLIDTDEAFAPFPPQQHSASQHTPSTRGPEGLCSNYRTSSLEATMKWGSRLRRARTRSRRLQSSKTTQAQARMTMLLPQWAYPHRSRARRHRQAHQRAAATAIPAPPAAATTMLESSRRPRPTDRPLLDRPSTGRLLGRATERSPVSKIPSSSVSAIRILSRLAPSYERPKPSTTGGGAQVFA